MRTWLATSRWFKRIAAAAAIAGAAFAMTVAPASADDHGRWNNGRHHGWEHRHHRHYYQPRDVPPIYAPPVYYATPPRVPYYAPPPVYAPAPGLSIIIPFR